MANYHKCLEELKAARENIKMADPRHGRELLAAAGANYRFVRYLAAGGEGVLLIALDDSLKREVVVKFGFVEFNEPRLARATKLFSEFGLGNKFAQEKKSDFTERFRRGFRIQSDAHRIVLDDGLTTIGYVPEVFSIGENPLHCSMEHVWGKDLLDWCIRSDTKKPVMSLFHKMIVLVEHALHGHGIIHADLKPSNWMVSNDGRPILLDFNVSHVFGVQDGITGLNAAWIGSVLFSSSEQMMESKYRDYRDDTFTLALTFWCMWTGTLPELKHPVTRIDQIRHDELFPAVALPGVFRPIFAKAIASKAERYQVITEFREDYERALGELDADYEVVEFGEEDWRTYVKNHRYIPVLDSFKNGLEALIKKDNKIL